MFSSKFNKCLMALTVAGAAISARADYRQPDTGFFSVPGLNYKYYEGTWTTLPNFATLTPVKSDSCTGLALSGVPHKATNFAVVFSGYINSDFDDDFTFYLNSKDGSQLLIGDSIVVNNDGLHATAAQASGKISLGSGLHRFTLRYFATTNPSLVVSYKSNSVDSQAIPDGAFHKQYTGVIPTITITAPTKGQTFKQGDTMTIKWTYTGGTGHTVFLDLSVDNGKHYPFLIKPTPYTITAENSEYKWMIPMNDSMITNQAVIGINDYIVGGPSDESEAFKILSKNAGVRQMGSKPGSRLLVDGKTLRYPLVEARKTGRVELSLFDLKGNAVPLKSRVSASAITWQVPGNLSGSYLAVLSINGAPQFNGLVTLF